MARSKITGRCLSAVGVALVLAAGLPGTLLAATAPSAPLNVTAAAGDDLVLLRWDAPVDDGGSPITWYLLSVYSDGVVLYQGELFPTGTEIVLGPNQLAINTLKGIFGLMACNADACGPETRSNEVTPTEGAALPQVELATIPPAGGTASTDPPAVQPSAANPVITAVTVPPTADGGSLSIAETAVALAPTGYTFLGQDIVIHSTAATDAEHPLSITFRVDPAQVPVTIFRNGLPVNEPCVPAGIAEPTPCIADGAGTDQITILSAAASTWNVGIANYAFGGFSSPVDDLPTTNVARAGRAIPVRFDLGGDQGRNVFAASSPRSSRVPCETGGSVDTIEETLASSSQLSYSAGTGLYQLGWNTERSWAGTCRELVLAFRDGSEARVRFAFR